jgi:hypothetical protein
MAKMGCAQCGKMMGKNRSKKMQKGGVSEIVGMPKYGNNPRTQEGRMLKNGGIKKAAYGMAMDSVPMTNTTVAKPKKPRVGKVTDKARVGMTVTNAAVKHSPPVGKRHNATHTGYESVAQKRKGGMTKSLLKANNGASTGSATTPLTEAEKKKLQTTWEQRNKRPLPAGSELVPSSDNFRTGAGGYSVYIKPVKKSKIGGAKMAKGGATSFGMLSVKAGIDKDPRPTAADRIAGATKRKRAKKK